MTVTSNSGSRIPRYFRLSLPARLVLAVLSGVPAVYLFFQPGPWGAMEGVMLGIFVLAPAVGAAAFSWLRVMAAIGLGFICHLALVFMTINLRLWAWVGVLDFAIFANPVLVTTALLLSVAVVARIKITRQFIVLTMLAALFSGASFYVFISVLWNMFCFTPCPWWNDLAFSAGWVVWHVAICVTLFLGNAGRRIEAVEDPVSDRKDHA